MDMHTRGSPDEDWSYIAAEPGTTKKWKKGLEQILPYHLQSKHGPANSLIPNFQLPELRISIL